jgi:hypothetical protein
VQEYKGQEQIIAESVLKLLSKYKSNNQRPDKIDLFTEAKDPEGKDLSERMEGIIEKVRFLEADGYLSVFESKDFKDQPYYEFELTKDGARWLEISNTGLFSRELVRKSVLKVLAETEEEMPWLEILSKVKELDQSLRLVSKKQILKAVKYWVGKDMVSWNELYGDGKTLDFHAEITTKGLDLIEENGNSLGSGSLSVNISNVSNSNLSLHSPHSIQSITSVSKKEASSAMRLEIESILRSVDELKLSIDGVKFENYLQAALSGLEDSPPDLEYAAGSAKKALSMKEVVDGLESMERTATAGNRAWNACKNLYSIVQNFGTA